MIDASHWPVIAIAAPLAAAAAGAGRLIRAEHAALASLPLGFAVAALLVHRIAATGVPVVATIGDDIWLPSVVFRADGIAAAMMLATSVITSAIAIAAYGTVTPRHARVFWALLPAQAAILNLAFLSADLLVSYLALETLAFAAMPLFCMDRTAEQIEAALRYLLYAGVGSVLYLCGAALLWREFGTLDLAVLAARVQGTPASIAAAALMTAGLAAKTALFPLHAWLPPAHAGAPPAASALHAALVVKGPFFLLLRLWSDGVVALPGYGAAQLVAAFGAAAIVLGGLAALAQDRLKALVAWSTVGQVGYLFVMLPMLAATDGGRAWLGGMLQALAHALAKAGMFLAAGSITDAMREDRLDRLQGAAARRPVAVAAFLACGLSLMGVPPSGGFTAKWLLLTAALSTGQWWWAVVIVLGGVLTGGYVWRVAAAVLAGPAQPAASPSSQDPWRSGALVVLSIVSMVLGLLPLGAFQVIAIGRGPGVMQ